jgi:hypothetical protein
MVGRASVPATQVGHGLPPYRGMLASYQDEDCIKFL